MKKSASEGDSHVKRERSIDKGGYWTSYCRMHGHVADGSLAFIEKAEKKHREDIPGLHKFERLFEDEP